MAGDSPPRSSRDANILPISARDVEAAHNAVAEAQAVANSTDVLADRENDNTRQRVLQELAARFAEIEAAAKASAAAAAAEESASAATPPMAEPTYRDGRTTDLVTRAAVNRTKYELRLEFKALDDKVNHLAGDHAAPSVEGASGKSPPSPPKFDEAPGSLPLSHGYSNMSIGVVCMACLRINVSHMPYRP